MTKRRKRNRNSRNPISTETVSLLPRTENQRKPSNCQYYYLKSPQNIECICFLTCCFRVLDESFFATRGRVPGMGALVAPVSIVHGASVQEYSQTGPVDKITAIVNRTKMDVVCASHRQTDKQILQTYF